MLTTRVLKCVTSLAFINLLTLSSVVGDCVLETGGNLNGFLDEFHSALQANGLPQTKDELRRIVLQSLPPRMVPERPPSFSYIQSYGVQIVNPPKVVLPPGYLFIMDNGNGDVKEFNRFLPANSEFERIFFHLIDAVKVKLQKIIHVGSRKDDSGQPTCLYVFRVGNDVDTTGHGWIIEIKDAQEKQIFKGNCVPLKLRIWNEYIVRLERVKTPSEGPQTTHPTSHPPTP